MNEYMKTVFDKQMHLYLVHNTHTHLDKYLSSCQHYFSLLRKSEQQHLHAYALLNDLWHFYYYDDEQLFFEPNNTMYYSVRAAILHLFTTSDTILKIKTWVQHSIEFSLIAAIDLVNIYADLYTMYILPAIQQTKYATLMQQFRGIDTKILFSERFKIYIEQPREFTEMQAYIVKLLTKNTILHEKHVQQTFAKYAERMKKMYVMKDEIFS